MRRRMVSLCLALIDAAIVALVPFVALYLRFERLI